jgi:hypothetical protein
MSDFAAIRFLSGRPLLRELSADRLNTILTEIKRNKPKGERGITVRQDGTGTYIGLAASLPSGGGGTPATPHPFQVLLRQFEEEGPWFWGVINNSKLFRDITGFDPGLDGSLGAQALEEDPNWFEIDSEDDDYIYIEYDATENTYQINSIGNGGTYDPDVSFPNEESEIALDLEATPATLLFARKVIAKAEQPEEEGQAPIITQGIKQHQLVQDVVYQGYPVRYFFDYTSI